LSRRYIDSRVVVHCRIPQRAMSHLSDPGTIIRPHAGNGIGHPGEFENGHGSGARGGSGIVWSSGQTFGNGHAATESRENPV
jgi:hypothetical protein